MTKATAGDGVNNKTGWTYMYMYEYECQYAYACQPISMKNEDTKGKQQTGKSKSNK